MYIVSFWGYFVGFDYIHFVVSPRLRAIGSNIMRILPFLLSIILCAERKSYEKKKAAAKKAPLSWNQWRANYFGDACDSLRCHWKLTKRKCFCCSSSVLVFLGFSHSSLFTIYIDTMSFPSYFLSHFRSSCARIGSNTYAFFGRVNNRGDCSSVSIEQRKIRDEH